MDKKQIITKFESNYEFFNQYSYSLNFNKYKFYNKEEVNKAKEGRFYKINDNTYVKLPKLTRKTWRIIAASLAGLLVAGSATTVAVFYMPHQVKINSNCLEIVGNPKACLASDFKCTFKIKDEYLPTRYMDNIDISAVKVNGNKIPAEDYYFTYQNNAKNELVINKKYLGGKVEIDADLIKRTATHHCFFFGYEDFTFSADDVIYPDKSKVGDYHAVKEGSDTDNMQLNPGYDMAITQKGDDPIHFNYNAFIVKEDNAFEIKLHALKGKKLPENLWFRCYAKFTKKDTDFTITFNSDYTEAILKVNYFVIRDSGSIVPKPEDA